MITEDEKKILSEFHSLKLAGGLSKFLSRLDLSDNFSKSVAYYAATWKISGDADAPFNPFQYLSEDGSSVLFGECPVIFGGQNQWNLKGYRSQDDLSKKTDAIFLRCRQIREDYPKAKICAVLAPEKDYFLSRYILEETKFCELQSTVHALGERLSNIGISLVFDQPLETCAQSLDLRDFTYPDSHLPPSVYVELFLQILESLDLPRTKTAPRVTMSKANLYGDLATKYSPILTRPYESDVISFESSGVEQLGGSLSLENPLRDTYQIFECQTAEFSENLVILGDSHCTIFERKKLTYLLANVFSNTTFYWNPMMLRQTIDCTKADTIILEASSRFML